MKSKSWIILIFTLLIISIVLFSIENNLENTDSKKSSEISNFTDRELEFKVLLKRPIEQNNEVEYVIKSKSELTKFFSEETIESLESENIDFKKEMLVVAFGGIKDTSGYKIEIKKIVETKDSVKVYIEKSSSIGNSLQGFTYPWQIVRTQKVDKEIEFVKNQI